MHYLRIYMARIDKKQATEVFKGIDKSEASIKSIYIND